MAMLRQSVRLAATVGKTSRLLSATVSKRNYAEMAFTFASPAQVFYDGANVKQVDVPSINGSFGILPDHVPLLAVLQPGIVTVHEESGSKKIFVSSGSVTVNADSSVQILAEEAQDVDKIDAQSVRDGLNKAQQELNSASNERAKAEAQIAVDCYDALDKAIHNK